MPKKIEVDLALITYDDELRRDGELSIIRTATKHAAHTLSLLHTVPGIGKSLSLVRLYAIHDMARFPRGQDFVSYGRLAKGAQEAAGKRLGPAGTKIGNAPLTRAFSEAAAWFVRNHPQGQTSLGRLEHKHENGKALTILAHHLARAVYDMLKRQTAFDTDIFLRASESRAAEPEVSLDAQRKKPASRVLTVLLDCVLERQGGHLGPVSLSLTGCWDIRAGGARDGAGRTRLAWAAPPLSLTRTGEDTRRSQPSAEDSLRAQHSFSVAAEHRNGALHSSPR